MSNTSSLLKGTTPLTLFPKPKETLLGCRRGAAETERDIIICSQPDDSSCV